MVLTHPGGGYSFNPARHFPTRWESQMQQSGAPGSASVPPLLSHHHTHTHTTAPWSGYCFDLSFGTNQATAEVPSCLHGSGVVPKVLIHVYDAGRG